MREIIFSSSFNVKKLRLREVKWFVWCHPNNRQKDLTASGERELLCCPIHVSMLEKVLIGSALAVWPPNACQGGSKAPWLTCPPESCGIKHRTLKVMQRKTWETMLDRQNFSYHSPNGDKINSTYFLIFMEMTK